MAETMRPPVVWGQKQVDIAVRLFPEVVKFTQIIDQIEKQRDKRVALISRPAIHQKTSEIEAEIVKSNKLYDTILNYEKNIVINLLRFKDEQAVAREEQEKRWKGKLYFTVVDNNIIAPIRGDFRAYNGFDQLEECDLSRESENAEFALICIDEKINQEQAFYTQLRLAMYDYVKTSKMGLGEASMWLRVRELDRVVGTQKKNFSYVGSQAQSFREGQVLLEEAHLKYEQEAVEEARLKYEEEAQAGQANKGRIDQVQVEMRSKQIDIKQATPKAEDKVALTLSKDEYKDAEPKDIKKENPEIVFRCDPPHTVTTRLVVSAVNVRVDDALVQQTTQVINGPNPKKSSDTSLQIKKEVRFEEEVKIKTEPATLASHAIPNLTTSLRDNQICNVPSISTNKNSISDRSKKASSGSGWATTWDAPIWNEVTPHTVSAKITKLQPTKTEPAKQSGPFCFACNEYGHADQYCPIPDVSSSGHPRDISLRGTGYFTQETTRQIVEAREVCSLCHQRGHTVKSCPDISLETDRVCIFCKKRGHTKNECWQARPEVKRGGEQTMNGNSDGCGRGNHVHHNSRYSHLFKPTGV